MRSYPCPSCGAQVTFQSAISVYAVCPYCSSMLVRTDADVQSIGTMAALPDDMSPLQLGTEGSYNGKRFGIIGRARMSWGDGAWNEWFLYVDDGTRAWLAEAQGFFAISFEADSPLPTAVEHLLANIKAGKRELGLVLPIEEHYLQITDIREAECVGSEGELPFKAPKSRKALYLDLLGRDGEFGGIEIEESGMRIYVGEYVEFDALRFSNLRELEGWQYKPTGTL